MTWPLLHTLTELRVGYSGSSQGSWLRTFPSQRRAEVAQRGEDGFFTEGTGKPTCYPEKELMQLWDALFAVRAVPSDYGKMETYHFEWALAEPLRSRGIHHALQRPLDHDEAVHHGLDWEMGMCINYSAEELPLVQRVFETARRVLVLSGALR